MRIVNTFSKFFLKNKTFFQASYHLDRVLFHIIFSHKRGDIFERKQYYDKIRG